MFRKLLTLTAALLASHAGASTISISGFALGSVSVDTSLSGFVGAGELIGTLQDGGSTSSFLTYCTEITQSVPLNTPFEYTVVATGSAHGLTALQADRLGKLYTLAGAEVDTKNESVAFQLAVWEIVHEAASNPLDLTTGSFLLEAGGLSSQRSLASGWLASISAAGAANSFLAQRLYSPSAQDFISFSPMLNVNITGGTVPEPAGWALTGVALAGLLASRKRVSRSRP